MAKSIKLTDSTISVTYSELVQLRNSGALYPGATYRITDYQCSSSDADTSVASNKFDILVKAIDTDKLSEHCGALRNTSDSYFPEETNFEAWEIWYCLDNDTSRFGWASASGKGIIYRLIDEFGNDCPYDFKNIMFKRTASWFSSHEDWCNEALGDVPTTDKLYFTFSLIASANSNGTDLSTNYYNGQKYLKFYQNKIAPYYSDSVQQLNKNVFILKSIGNMGCYSNTFGNNCYSNTFGNYCQSNTFGNYCQSNTFGNNCFSNTFGNNCFSNTFGNNCYSNTFGNYCQSNAFGNNCYSNTFGNYCQSNTFGNNCFSNTFGNNCFSNTFGNYCQSNTFGNYCYSNAFGNNCDSNTFGNNCDSNTFGNYCYSNTFGNNCDSNTFGRTSTSLQSYCRYNCLEDGVQYTYFYTTQTTSSSNYLQNITIHRGVKGSSSSSRKTISVTEVNKSYNREYGNNASGTLVNWVANA